jgi:pyridinium-3,5-biscarboxylic acid mononucleotide sulfurtransferase
LFITQDGLKLLVYKRVTSLFIRRPIVNQLRKYLDAEQKLDNLKSVINNLGKVAVAFSGGVDSSFLLKVCRDVLEKDTVAITIVSPMMPKSEIEDAIQFTKSIGIEHILISDDSIEEEVLNNSVDRCYFCKKIEFNKIVKAAEGKGIKYVIDGSNTDDELDYRPGLKALKELKIISPLRIAGLAKKEIRELSKRLNLETWNKPALACLASRIPYGEKITIEKLSTIDGAESYLKKLGLIQFRVRSHGDIARIEIAPEERDKLFDTALMDKISRELKLYGFTYVCMEFEGYKTGNMNEKILKG